MHGPTHRYRLFERIAGKARLHRVEPVWDALIQEGDWLCQDWPTAEHTGPRRGKKAHRDVRGEGELQRKGTAMGYIRIFRSQMGACGHRGVATAGLPNQPQIANGLEQASA